MSDDFEPMTSTDAVRMWELDQMSLPEPAGESTRIRELETALALEKHTAILNAEGHKREIRKLQDMLEAEEEARREAEGRPSLVSQ